MNEEFEVLKEVISQLNQANISYLISGSVAANYYTIPRMTRDIDIVIELTRDDISQFTELFSEGYYIEECVVEEEVRRRGMFNLIHKEYSVKVDFILHKETDFQKEMFNSKKTINIDGIPMQIISLENLILMKLLWAKDSLSEMQLNDVKNLIKTATELDTTYIENWVNKLDIGHIYNKVNR